MHSYAYTTPQKIINESGDILVSPLRDPFKVWTTWFQRYGGRDYMLDPDHPKSMESAWRAMAALDRYFQILYIPVDVPNKRDEMLSILSEKMNKKLVTDWTPVGSRPDERKTQVAPDKNIDWIYRLPFVARFY